jgi:two-component system, NarL family, nitrate/nitrite sensor histidine kinase NarX
MTSTWVISVILSISILIGLIFWLFRRIQEFTRTQRKMEALLEESKKSYRDVQEQYSHTKNKLEVIHRLNLGLADINDDKALVEAVLDQVSELVKAGGSSFIPFDEWGDPLPAISRGRIPEPALKAWSEHLLSNGVRQQCKNCQVLEASNAGECPLAKSPFPNIINIQCIPIHRNGRVMGMLNLYTQTSSHFDAGTREFLEDVANELAVVLESIRLRRQELTTFRQLQMNRSLAMNPEVILVSFLEQVNIILKVDFSLLIVQSSAENTPRFYVRSGLDPQSHSPAIDLEIRNAIDEGQLICKEQFEDPVLFASGKGTLVATPLELANRPIFGALIVGRNDHLEVDTEVINSIAYQAALLVDVNLHLAELEYTSVVKERSRLAREIHDGLAQTLAFLKLQTGQMQNFLNRGELQRLTQALQTNYIALSDAYLDIRQSIDNLRLTPSDGLQNWLGQIANDFRKTTGLNVNLEIKISPSVRDHLSAEIQAQLIRIVQEALSNVRKHAHGSMVRISMREWDGDLILELQDDGQGFSPEDIPGLSQYGLRGMRERAELIGADFQIISQPNQGTTVKIRLPYPLEESMA